MSINYVEQNVKPVDDGSPSTTASKTNINDALALLTPLSSTHPGYIAGRWYALDDTTTANTAVAAADTLYFFPFLITQSVTITSMIMRVATAGAGSAVKAGIWANSSVSMRPLGTPLYSDNTGVATTSSTTTVTLAIAGTLTPGLYWYGSKFTGTLPTMNCWTSINGFGRLVGVPTAAGIYPNLHTGISIADTYSNAIGSTSIAEGASFTAMTASGVPTAAIVT